MAKTLAMEFAGGDGALRSGRLEMPAGEPRAYGVFAHCFTCGKDSLAAVRIARGLAKAGFAILRFDFAGVGASEGEFGRSSFAGRVGDIIAACEAMADGGRPPELLIGHSLGGAAVLAAAGSLPKIGGICTIAAPFDPGHLRIALGETAAEAEAAGAAELTINGRSFEISRALLEELAAHDPADSIAALRRPLLVIHAPTDEVVGAENARSILSAAQEPKRFVSLDGADHTLSRAADARRVAAIIAEWAAPIVGQAA